MAVLGLEVEAETEPGLCALPLAPKVSLINHQLLNMMSLLTKVIIRLDKLRTTCIIMYILICSIARR